MGDIERRALMGDKEAQRQCTENGIILPCPWCKCKVSDLKNTHAIKWFWRKCRFCGAESPAQETEFKANLYWNTRTAPPIGRCKDCANWDKEHSAGRESLGNYVCVCHEWSDEEDGHMRYTPFDGFCNNFEPKEEPKNEE